MKLDCIEICILPRITTTSTSTNRKFSIRFYFWISSYWFFEWKNTPLCNFCNKNKETPLHIFCEYTPMIYLWQKIATFLKAICFYQRLHCTVDSLFWLWSDNKNPDDPIINQGLIIFNLCMYSSRKKHNLNIINLLIDIKETKKTEYPLLSNGEKRKVYQNK